MGKKLIIKGANFAQNAIPDEGKRYIDLSSITFYNKSLTDTGLGDDNPQRVSCAPLSLTSIGLTSGKTLYVEMPQNYVVGLGTYVSGTRTKNLYWHYASLSASVLASTYWQSLDAEHKLGNSELIYDGQLAISFGLLINTPTPPNVYDIIPLNSVMSMINLGLIRMYYYEEENA